MIEHTHLPELIHADGGRVADAAPHRLPAGVSDRDGVDERIAHQTADQAHNAVSGEHAGGWISVPRRFRALDVVHGLDEVVDAEWDRGHKNYAEKLEAGEHMVDSGDRHREAEIQKWPL